jgi:hypothetical protein
VRDLVKELNDVIDDLTARKMGSAAEAVRMALYENIALREHVVGANVGAGWQPIETAPKDGAHVLVGRVGVSPARAWFEGDRWWMHGCGPNSRNVADLTGRFAPTHWMPLPEPPSDVGVKVGVNAPQA